MRPYIYILRRSTRGKEEGDELVGLGRRWESCSLGSNRLENYREGERFYSCIRRMGGISILKHLGHEGFLLQLLQCEEATDDGNGRVGLRIALSMWKVWEQS